MKINRLYALLILTVTSLFLVVTVHLIYNPWNLSRIVLKGSMYANDCGEPRGGFEWAGEYAIEVVYWRNSGGIMKVIFKIGLGDPLERHEYYVEKLSIDVNSTITLVVEGHTITLIYYEHDDVWNEFHHHYIARYVDPTVFEGFPKHYYVEIRLTIEKL